MPVAILPGGYILLDTSLDSVRREDLQRVAHAFEPFATVNVNQKLIETLRVTSLWFYDLKVVCFGKLVRVTIVNHSMGQAYHQDAEDCNTSLEPEANERY